MHYLSSRLASRRKHSSDTICGAGFDSVGSACSRHSRPFCYSHGETSGLEDIGLRSHTSKDGRHRAGKTYYREILPGRRALFA
jgi:hypothetical protein